MDCNPLWKLCASLNANSFDLIRTSSSIAMLWAVLYQVSPKSPTADDLRTVIWKSINSFIGLVVVGLVTAGLCYKKWTGARYESPSPGSRNPLTGQRFTELAINAINRFHIFLSSYGKEYQIPFVFLALTTCLIPPASKKRQSVVYKTRTEQFRHQECSKILLQRVKTGLVST